MVTTTRHTSPKSQGSLLETKIIHSAIPIYATLSRIFWKFPATSSGTFRYPRLSYELGTFCICNLLEALLAIFPELCLEPAPETSGTQRYGTLRLADTLFVGCTPPHSHAQRIYTYICRLYKHIDHIDHVDGPVS